jgi:SAM-dependent methyltransferase
MTASSRAADEGWLDRHADLVAAVRSTPLLELGCGEGRDTLWLAAHHPCVVAVDLSTAALDACAERAPAAHRVCLDLGRTLPFRSRTFGLVVASLSLHYFESAAMHRVVAEVRRCMADDGWLVCRVNSLRDVHFGARGYPVIERHVYRVRGRVKRFFDGADLRTFFGPAFECRSRFEHTIDRYPKSKVVWELRLAAR